MKKKLLLILVLAFYTGMCSSEILKVVGPSVVTQFSIATYKVTVNKYRGSGAYSFQRPYGYQCYDFKGKKIGENLYECIDTLVFTRSGQQSIFNDVAITVIPNPVKLETPLHICPYGTQLITNETDPYLQKRFSIVKSNSAVNISDTGILTYDPSVSEIITVRYELFFRGEHVFQWIDKDVRLNPHYDNLIGMYNINMNGSIQRRYLSPTSNNPVNNGQAVEITFQQNLYNFSWEFLSETGAFQMSYNPNSKLFRFIPSYQVGGGFRFRFYYNDNPNCTHLNFCDFGFTVRNPYSVAYIASSNMISISREDKSTVQNRMLTNDAYRIVNALTGVSQKQGQLTKGTNEIDVSNLSNGIYIVQITSGDNTESYKISINR